MVITMINKIKNVKTFYRSLGSNTKLIIRITLICVITLILMSVYAYTATHSPFHYELLLICDDLLEVTKSVAVVGLLGTLMFSYLEREPEKNNN